MEKEKEEDEIEVGPRGTGARGHFGKEGDRDRDEGRVIGI